MAHEKWQEQTVRTLVDLGIDPADARRGVKWVVDHLPPNADPATHIFTGDELYEDPASAAAIADSRADWYAKDSVLPKFKAILDATERTE
jgi:hypothetical protein